jgi:ATP diphosphatase
MDNVHKLLDIMARLRDPEHGCPWDREQTFHSIAPYTIEEAYEVAHAIELGDMAALKDELGDLLFQVVFYAQMAQEQGEFDFNDVAEIICDKMVRRHPHVFAGARYADSAEQTRAWEAIKAGERSHATSSNEPASLLDGITHRLPAMNVAEKLQKRAATVDFDWPDVDGVLDKLREETVEMQQEIDTHAAPERLQEELGDLLFTCVNLARVTDTDAEMALRLANRRFEQRFRVMEQLCRENQQTLQELDAEAMDALWEQAKHRCES